MIWHIYTDQIKEILEQRLPVISQPQPVAVYRAEFLSFQPRIDFYSDKDNIKDFKLKFDEFTKNFDIEFPELTFYDKFRIYKLVYPDYEVWSPALHCAGLSGHAKQDINAGSELECFCKYSVSTSGKLWTHGLSPKGEKPRFPAANKYGYLRTQFSPEQSLMLHRVILSTFGSDIDYNSYGKSSLTVNHKDTIRDNNELLNLEWMTHMENIMDMSLNDRCEHSSQPIKATVDIDLGIPIGSVFYLRRRSDIREYGVALKSFGTRLTKSNNVFGCIWEDCVIDDVDESKLGMPDEVANWISYRQVSNTIPVEITLDKDLHGYPKGHVFYLTKRTMLRDIIGNKQILKILALDKSEYYRNCLWRYLPKVVNMKIDEASTMEFLRRLFGGG